MATRAQPKPEEAETPPTGSGILAGFNDPDNIKVKITLVEPPRRGLSAKQMETALKMIQARFGLSDEEAIGAIATILQKGGTNSNKNTNITVVINDKTIDSKTIAGIIRSNCSNASPRMFARQIATQIYNVCKVLDVPGNLAIRLERNYTSEWGKIKDSNKIYWAADFQSGNPDCPEDIKTLIRKNYEDTFKTKTTQPQSK